jgi:hypothetical protein
MPRPKPARQPRRVTIHVPDNDEAFDDDIELPPRWEELEDHLMTTQRMRVPGGWLVRSTARESGEAEVTIAIAIVFLPDPGHEWRLS